MHGLFASYAYLHTMLMSLMPQMPQRESAGGAPSSKTQQGAAAAGQASSAKASRVRHRKAVLASGALTNTVQTALKALQVGIRRLKASKAQLRPKTLLPVYARTQNPWL